jgi:hypothetical protein
VTPRPSQRRHYMIAAQQQKERELRKRIAAEVEDFCEERHTLTSERCDCGTIAIRIERGPEFAQASEIVHVEIDPDAFTYFERP